MPFESSHFPRRRIAVVGGGISGLGAARLLSRNHDVTLVEAAPRLGGHARTVLAGKRGDQPVDTGFIVFNYPNYPLLTRLFDELGVPVVKSDMSFGASVRGGRIEYGLSDLRAVFAQLRNMADPRFIGMLRDVMRFNKRAVAASHDPAMTIGDLLASLGTGIWFRDYYLLPLSGAIWSTPKEKILDFPARAMVQFFKNHALLSHTGQHQWYTVRDGSAQYVTRLEAALRSAGVDIRLSSPVEAIRRRLTGPELRIAGQAWEAFDEVVLATHSDDSLRMLIDPTIEEQAGLSAIRYQPNEVILHADDGVMPRNRRAWASWNYREAQGRIGDSLDLTYWMNRLQPIPQDDPMFVTLNATRAIDPAKIYDQVTMRHPVYDAAALAAQEDMARINGHNNTWFCGAWMRNGFHEDGLASAVDVVEGIASTTPGPAALAAE
ncbi:Putative cyclopropane/cyclopropene fatty acid synthesis protein, flavin amine oxidase [Pseudooceanicola batsensis HTCC2597]|uniref:Putative cyclopropane/cyclopropene fatty acid synthesis protein, flavin amine oxidase n=1 Tax=Pseudooceanicola batsensis (strain ATCC BAA-863 / DSM 15984 / KCTC 12145 / HTCC2597) TaxID=252305 RepID=A3TYG5_PSEBH|nr:FAD-dependent oxidoreductase [Pseudooceanicola batsensis]EAQ03199.1 Putative cyclopropane/cyclopropene fatty acid synthesis protein, flavin amine oxidase [Pseudooceanicola batsensis HTCC2597]